MLDREKTGDIGFERRNAGGDGGRQAIPARTAVKTAAGGMTEQDLDRYVVEACCQLIRFDTTNYGGGESRGEREAAEWVAGELSGWGYAPVVLESAPRRASTVVRIPGRDPAAPGLLVHGHLDVVPAAGADWSVAPFAGEVRDGQLFGRGALDMKGMDAMMLAAARMLATPGREPARDIVLAFVADEEDTGSYGAGFLVDEHAELFEGVSCAVGESGGTLTELPDGSHLYPVATGERGTAWITLTARGGAGHGSRPHPDNAVATLARTVSDLAAIEWPVRLTPTVGAFLEAVSARLGTELDPGREEDLERLGGARRYVESTLRHSLTPTMLSAGYKANVIPSEATATLDGRILPGGELEEEFFATIDARLPPSVSRSFASYARPVSAGDEPAELAVISEALRRHDPAAIVLAFIMSGGTDAKSFSRLGIPCVGFTPARYPAGFPAESYVHGVDERVPLDSLHFGARVLHTYLRQPPTVPRRTKEKS